MAGEKASVSKEVCLSDPRVFPHGDVPGVHPLIEKIRADRTGGYPIRKRLKALGIIMGGRWLEDGEKGQDRTTLISVPRSGIPLSEGLYHLLPSCPYIQANCGLCRDPGKPLLPFEKLKNSGKFVIVDSVIFTGATIIQFLNALEGAKITIFAAVVAPNGVKNILSQTKNDIEIHFGESESGTKTGWDPHFYRVRTSMANIGNIGYLVSR